MRKLIIAVAVPLLFSAMCMGQGNPHINVYPPQMHQQICLESTFTRYLQIFNTGDSILHYNAGLYPDTISWVTASPLSGQVEPGDTSLIEFDFNSAGLPLNNYYADFIISSNDPDDSSIVVLTMVHVQILNILINPEPDSICLGCSALLKTSVIGCSGDYSFAWNSDPPGFSSFEKSPTVSPKVTTTYTITVTDGNYSDQKSVLIEVGGPSGFKEEQLISNFSIFPNPCDEVCTIKFSSEYHGSGRINIIDPAGNIIRTIPVILNNEENELKIITSNIDPGAYLLSLQTEDGYNGLFLLSSKLFIR